ncbi:MAG TPA: MFS transporter [Thermoanaerobaculia bacterium]|nr:MFS transporter [Thermoanaerobaculia bacterium]
MTSAALPTRLSHHPRPVGAHRTILALAWGTWTAGFYSLMLLSFVLQPIQDAFALGEGELARLTAVGVGMTGVGGLLFGWMSDRLGRRASLAAGIAAFCLGNAGCGLAPGPLWLLAARALAGLGIGGTWGAGQALLGETFPPALRGRYAAVAQTGAPIGLGLAAAVGSFVVPAIGWRAAFLLSAAPALVLLFYRRLPESDLWLEHRRRLLARAAGAAGGAAGAGGAGGSAAAEAEMARARRPILAQLVAPDLLGRFSGAFVLTALNMSAYWFAIVWLPRYLQKQRGLSIFGSGWWTLTFVAGSLLGYLSFGWASDAIGRRRAFAIYSAITALGLAMVTLFWGLLESRPLAGLGCMLVAGLGTGTWSCYGPFFSELFPTRVRGAAMSVIMNVTRGVQFAAPLVIAAVAGRWGLAGGVALAAGFALLAGAWVWTLPETAGAPIEA